jgi:hypothetical protein
MLTMVSAADRFTSAGAALRASDGFAMFGAKLCAGLRTAAVGALVRSSYHAMPRHIVLEATG